MNDIVIKPAMRENKAEDASQPLEQPELKIIGEIEGLISQVNEKLGELPVILECFEEPIYVMRKKVISKALEEIDEFQKTTLHELRKELE